MNDTPKQKNRESTTPKRDVRLRREKYCINIGIDMQVDELSTRIGGLSELFNIRDLLTSHDFIVQTSLRPKHTTCIRKSIHPSLIKNILFNDFEIEITNDDKILIKITLIVEHWSKLKSFDILNFKQSLTKFLDIPPEKIILLLD